MISLSRYHSGAAMLVLCLTIKSTGAVFLKKYLTRNQCGFSVITKES